MLGAFNEEFLAALGESRNLAGEAAAHDRAVALMREIGAAVFETKLTGHPLLFDQAEFEALGRAASALLGAQVKILQHLRATRPDSAVLDLFGMPRRLLPFMRWENLQRPGQTVARLDIIPTRTGYAVCELNVIPAVGGGEAYRCGELYFQTLGYPRADLPPCPLQTLAAMYSAQVRSRDFARVVILDSVEHGRHGYPRQELLQRYLREANPGLTVELLDEERYPAGWLTRGEGERTLVHRMFTYEEVTDDFAFLDKLWQSGATIAGFESDLRMSKRFLALMCDPAYQALLGREELDAIEKFVPHSFALSEATLASALRGRNDLVFKWDAPASYGGTGVLIGAEWSAAELEHKLRANGVEHWICQQAIEAEMLPLRTPGDATPLDYRIVLGLYSYGGTPSGFVLRGSHSSRVVNASSASGRIGWAFVVSDDTRRALIRHARGQGNGTL
jgi:hypothetical protein